MLADLPVLWRLVQGMPKSGSHQQRLEGFYAGQAAHYDRFRERLLQGRAETVAALADALPASGGTLVELGCGTGRNLAYLGARREQLWRAWGVDLSPSLLAQARQRAWPEVQWIEADATTWRPPAPVDAVLCSYSLTMIPDWFAAVDNALAMLRPGGVFAVVDFCVPRDGRLARTFWPWWFGHDGVHPNADLVPYLRHKLPGAEITVSQAKVPYLPGLRVPYFRCIGWK